MCSPSHTAVPGTSLKGETAGRKEENKAEKKGRKTGEDTETKRRVRELTVGFKGGVCAKAN